MHNEQTSNVHGCDARRELGSMKPVRTGGIGSAILIVERDPAPAHSVCRFLRRRGHEVRVVHSAEEQIAAPDSSRPGAVLFNFDLPGSAGLQALARLCAAKLDAARAQ